MKHPGVVTIPSAIIQIMSGLVVMLITLSIWYDKYPWPQLALGGLGTGMLFGFYAWKWWPGMIAKWTMPPTITIPAPKIVDNRPAETHWHTTPNTQRIYHTDTITMGQLKEIAYRAIQKRQTPNDRALSEIIGNKVSAWRDELMPRYADWNSYNKDGRPNKTKGWYYTQEGLDMLRSVIDDPPPLPYDEWVKRTYPAYTHTEAHTR